MIVLANVKFENWRLKEIAFKSHTTKTEISFVINSYRNVHRIP